jgi:hypothetical protein
MTLLFHISGTKVRRLKKDAAPTIFPEFSEGNKKPSISLPKKCPAPRSQTRKIYNSSSKIYVLTGHSCVPSAGIEIKMEAEELLDPLEISTSCQ